MLFNDSIERMKSNPKILIIPLLYNLILYIYFLIGDFKLGIVLFDEKDPKIPS